MDFKTEVLKIKDQMIEDIKTLCAIPSMNDEATAGENAPYGQANRDALDKMLEICKRDGFEGVDVDGHAGHVDIGEGEQTIGILGHLDVVPVNPTGWDSDPFNVIEKDGKLYGRGVADDKGPLMAGYYAAKIINNMDFKKKMKTRVIFGCNEELGSSCLKYYFTKKPFPEMGFTPDAEFPVVYGEKAGCDFVITGNVEKNGLIYLGAGSRPNIVPESCEAIVEGNLKNYRDSFNEFLSINKLEGNIEEEGNHTKLVVKGKSAHASTPQEGLNAVTMMAKYLNSVINNSLVKFIVKYLSDLDGTALNIKHTSMMGPLTMNLGVISYCKENVRIDVDLRVPHDQDIDAMKENTLNACKEFNLDVEFDIGKALFVDPESTLIQSLHQAYVEVSGDHESKPQAIGGGTYAKTMPNCVAFGAEFKGDDTCMHGNNENMRIDSLLKATEIYCIALYNLMKAD